MILTVNIGNTHITVGGYDHVLPFSVISPGTVAIGSAVVAVVVVVVVSLPEDAVVSDVSDFGR